MPKKKRIVMGDEENSLFAALNHIMNMETKPIILNPEPQECPNCEEMRRIVTEYVDADAAIEDKLYSTAGVPDTEEVYTRYHKAKAALSTLKKQEEQP